MNKSDTICPTCDGKGVVSNLEDFLNKPTLAGIFSHTKRCGECQGSGRATPAPDTHYDPSGEVNTIRGAGEAGPVSTVRTPAPDTYTLKDVEANKSVGWFVEDGLVKQHINLARGEVRVVGKLAAPDTQPDSRCETCNCHNPVMSGAGCMHCADTQSSTDKPETYPTDTQPGDELEQIHEILYQVRRNERWLESSMSDKQACQTIRDLIKAAHTQGRQAALEEFSTTEGMKAAWDRGYTQGRADEKAGQEKKSNG